MRKFLRFPGYPYANVKKKDDVLEQLDLHERRMAIVTEAPPDGAEYRRLVVKPAQRVTGAIRTAGERIRAGDSPEYAYIDFSRHRDDFDEAYSFAAEDLELQGCVEEHLRTDELDPDFRRGANNACDEARTALTPLKPDAPLREFIEAHEELTRVTDELEALNPPERTRSLWRPTVRAAKDLSRALGETIELTKVAIRGGGEEALRKLPGLERRMDAASRRADRGLSMLNFNECADLF